MCGACDSDLDCSQRFGADSFCVLTDEDCFCDPNVGFCAVPCAACQGDHDCPAGCACRPRPFSDGLGERADVCVVRAGGRSLACAHDDDCAPTHQCVQVPAAPASPATAGAGPESVNLGLDGDEAVA